MLRCKLFGHDFYTMKSAPARMKIFNTHTTSLDTGYVLHKKCKNCKKIKREFQIEDGMVFKKVMSHHSDIPAEIT